MDKQNNNNNNKKHTHTHTQLFAIGKATLSGKNVLWTQKCL